MTEELKPENALPPIHIPRGVPTATWVWLCGALVSASALVFTDLKLQYMVPLLFSALALSELAFSSAHKRLWVTQQMLARAMFVLEKNGLQLRFLTPEETAAHERHKQETEGKEEEKP